MQEEHREIGRGSEEHPKLREDKAVGVYVPSAQTVQRCLLS